MTDWCEEPANPVCGDDADQSCDSASQSCPLQEENWIELEYLYCDSTGVVGAHYRVINDDDGSVVAQGTLDSNGFARCSLPLNINNVSYNFYSDPPTLQYRIQPVVNPELARVSPGWLERMTTGISEVGSWTWGTIQGDFNEDPSFGQIATNAAITMIPIVDQFGDGRDILANLKFLIWDKRYDDKWVWLGVVAALIGLIPVLGSAAKCVLKELIRLLKKGGKIPLDLLINILNKFHKGNAVTWLRRLAAELPNHAVTMKRKFRDILISLKEKMRYLADNLPGSLGRNAEDVANSVDEVARIADGKIDEAVKTLQDGLNKSLDEGVDFERKGATQSKNTRVQQEAEPSDALKTTASPVKFGERGRYTEPGAQAPTEQLRQEMKATKVREKLPPPEKPGWPKISSDEAVTFKKLPEPVELPEGTKLYRVIDSESNPNGSYWTTVDPRTMSEAQWRSGAAVKGEWNGDGAFVEYQVPKGGMKVWSGEAAPQMSSDGVNMLSGGGNQVWLPAGSTNATSPISTGFIK